MNCLQISRHPCQNYFMKAFTFHIYKLVDENDSYIENTISHFIHKNFKLPKKFQKFVSRTFSKNNPKLYNTVITKRKKELFSITVFSYL